MRPTFCEIRGREYFIKSLRSPSEFNVILTDLFTILSDQEKISQFSGRPRNVNSAAHKQRFYDIGRPTHIHKSSNIFGTFHFRSARNCLKLAIIPRFGSNIFVSGFWDQIIAFFKGIIGKINNKTMRKAPQS